MVLSYEAWSSSRLNPPPLSAQPDSVESVPVGEALNVVPPTDNTFCEEDGHSKIPLPDMSRRHSNDSMIDLREVVWVLPKVDSLRPNENSFSISMLLSLLINGGTSDIVEIRQIDRRSF
jgi:hypothetical protein